MSIAWYLAVSAIVFALGAVGVMTRRNPLVVLLCLELMLNGANLALIAFSRMWGNGDGNELGTQGYWAMLRYETDPELLVMWRAGWAAFFNRLDAQQGALWDLSNYVLGGDMQPQVERFARWLRLAPVDMIRWNVVNSNRRDQPPIPLAQNLQPNLQPAWVEIQAVVLVWVGINTLSIFS